MYSYNFVSKFKSSSVKGVRYCVRECFSSLYISILEECIHVCETQQSHKSHFISMLISDRIGSQPFFRFTRADITTRNILHRYFVKFQRRISAFSKIYSKLSLSYRTHARYYQCDCWFRSFLSHERYSRWFWFVSFSNCANSFQLSERYYPTM